jgi:hypothetical protein
VEPAGPGRSDGRAGADQRRLLRIEAPLETFGTGACGFDVYGGELREASFASITTHAAAGVDNRQGPRHR